MGELIIMESFDQGWPSDEADRCGSFDGELMSGAPDTQSLLTIPSTFSVLTCRWSISSKLNYPLAPSHLPLAQYFVS